MNDDTDVFFENSTACYLESLIRCRQHVKDSVHLSSKLDEVINLELDLAVMGAEKAKSEILKRTKDTVRPIK